eukprot:TRINITY_DN25032_c0_g3_i1.p1 TRINITY_DN25032_c0_g3~~TRINITY_DN25032_c0_g3_i1.p1  ORF type:complete len:325 (-),score=29.00 TRINITY_DN25032_c0_g3_i1:297-1271(-)
MQQVADDILSTGQIQSNELKAIFGNENGLPNGGTMYGIVINGKNAATGGFPQSIPIEERSKRIVIKDVLIESMNSHGIETPAMTEDGVTIIQDSVAAILVTDEGVTITDDGSYIGHVLSNAQLIVAKAIHDGFDFGRLNTAKNTISENIINWAESGLPLKYFGLRYICNTDHQFHVIKGNIAFRLDGSQDVTCMNCSVLENLNNHAIGSTRCNDNFEYKEGTGISHPQSDDGGFTGANCRGFTVTASHGVTLDQCQADTVKSKASHAYGFDVKHGSSNIILINPQTRSIMGGIGYSFSDYINNPTNIPQSQAIRQEDDTYVEIK